jgi:ATP-dependent DNA helicase RecQ
MHMLSPIPPGASEPGADELPPPSSDIDRARLLELLRGRFGHREFRPGQEAVVRHVAAGRDALVVMPTGAGKSLCFQLPALYREGLTIVVSPLIALMKDQVDALARAGIAASFVNSSIEPQERDERTRRALAGELRLLYVAPERWRGGSYARRLAGARIGLLVVDEAHCLSHWGHDFRPDYLRLGEVRRDLGDPPTVAATATATAEVRADILSVLRLREPGVFVTGFDRPNLRISVLPCRTRAEKEAALDRALARAGRPLLVYCATRRSVEEVAGRLAARGRAITAGHGGRAAAERVAAYHAGLSPDERARVQDEFQAGRLDAVVATNAFGMGIDRADVRAVLHWEIPRTIEAYYQEIGRAGRDGKASDVLLLHRPGDRRVQEFFIDNAHPPEEVVRRTWAALRRAEGETVFRTHASLAEEIGGGATDRMVGAALLVLEREAWLQRLSVAEASEERREIFGEDDPGGRSSGALLLRSEAELDLDWRRLRERRRREVGKLDAMVGWAQAAACRRHGILSYFGELPDWQSCGNCDVCERGGAGARGRTLGVGGSAGRAESRHDGSAGGVEFGPCGPLSPAAETLVRKALACVARMGDGHAAYMAARVLRGSKAQAVLAWRFDRLSTFGILANLTQDEVEALLAALVDAGCLVETSVTRAVSGADRRYKVLNLSPLGGRVMRQQEPGFEMAFPRMGAAALRRGGQVAADGRGPGGPAAVRDAGSRDPAPSPSRREAPELDGLDAALFDKLREARAALAEAHGAPPYVFGGNRLLEEIARSRPGSRDEMLELPGMGERMFERAGRAYLDAVTGFGTA